MGELEWNQGDVVIDPNQRSECISTMLMVLIFLSVYLLSLLVFSSRIENILKDTLSVA